jgi:N-acetylmuramoyl-L-alanine amidase
MILNRLAAAWCSALGIPPVFDLSAEKPLAGLKLAIEAGHGGSNSGAIGLSGLVEKEINLDLSFRLGELCAAMGAEVVQVRDSDRDMALLDKRDIAIKSGAHMLISIHANAGGRELSLRSGDQYLLAQSLLGTAGTDHL